MKRLMALLLVAVFCIVLFSPPAAAWCPSFRGDNGSPTPMGDDGGWADPHAKDTGTNETCIYSKYWFLKLPFYCVIKGYLHINNIDEDSLGTNEHTDLTGARGNREPSSPR